MHLTRTDLQAVERELCQRSLRDFIVQGWHVLEPKTKLVTGWATDAIADHLQGVTEGHLTRLLINVPPGMSKSLTTSVFWPAWSWTRNPSIRYLGTAHMQALATRDNRKCRQLIQSDWYQGLWGDRFSIVSDQNEKTKFENDRTGFRESMSFTSLTGSRGDAVILDDPLSVDDARSAPVIQQVAETFTEALPSRLNDPENSAIVVIMQRLHERDPSGLILEHELGYEHLMLPMEFDEPRRCYTVLRPRGQNAPPELGHYDGKTQHWSFDEELAALQDEAAEKGKPAPSVREVYCQDRRQADGELLFEERFPAAVVERDKKVMTAESGSYAVAGQFQQNPVPRGGGLFKKEWFIIKEAAPIGCKWARGWDLAATKSATAAFTAGVLIGRAPDGTFWIGDSTRIQGTPKEVEQLLKATASQDRSTYGPVRGSLPKDPGQAGKAQSQYLIGQLAGFDYHASPETGDKETRAAPLAAQAEAGNVFIVNGPWVKAFLDEATLFPVGKFKDQVDAASRAFAELVRDNIGGDDVFGAAPIMVTG